MGAVEFEGLVDALVDALRAGSHRGYLDARTALLRAHKPVGTAEAPRRVRCIDCNQPVSGYCPWCERRREAQRAQVAR